VSTVFKNYSKYTSVQVQGLGQGFLLADILLADILLADILLADILLAHIFTCRYS